MAAHARDSVHQLTPAIPRSPATVALGLQATRGAVLKAQVSTTDGIAATAVAAFVDAGCVPLQSLLFV